jgi:hypothetical protein
MAETWPGLTGFWVGFDKTGTEIAYETYCPYGHPGDTLWVREAWAVESQWDDTSPSVIPAVVPVWYRADRVDMPTAHGRWRASIHMSRWAARIVRPVKSIRVERVQDISDEDAEQDFGWPYHHPRCSGPTHVDGLTGPNVCWCGSTMTGEEIIAGIWDRLNAKPKPAKRNPYTGAPELCKVAYPWDDVREETIINRKSSPFHNCKIYIIGNGWVWVIGYERIEP